MIEAQTPTVKNIPPFIQTNVSLKDKNWFRTGGFAQYFSQPTSAHEFAQSLIFAHTHQLPIFLLGEGANILISDEGFAGLVIRPQLTNAHHVLSENNTVLVTAGAGITIHNLIEYCLNNHLVGLEEFSGIPGTVGGSVYINLHYFEFLLSQFLMEATVIHKQTGAIQKVDVHWFNFGYNCSTLQNNEYYLVDATFKLKTCSATEAAYARGRMTEIIRHRTKRYPTAFTCGSFFRNFFEHEVTLEVAGKKIIYVAYYLDKIGVKGVLTTGDAIVSYQHANMIVNKGNATSQDIIMLARSMQQLVYKQYGIIPQAECRLIGFSEYPLLK